MSYKVLKAFKCRHQDLKLFSEGAEYKSVDEKHTKKLIELGFIKEVKKTKKTPTKKQTKKKDDK